MNRAQIPTLHEAVAPAKARLLFSCLLENIPDRVYFKDEQSRFIAVSRAMAEFFGADDPANVVGKTDFDFFTAEHAQPAFDDEQKVMRTGEAMIGKVEKETLPDGRVGWALTSKMPLLDFEGRIIGTCGISKDITELINLETALEESNGKLYRHQAELEQALKDLGKAHENLKNVQEQLIQAEKSQSIGRLSAGLAHEIRNPLNILNMGLTYLSSLPAVVADESVGGILQDMKDAITRADSVISALMDTDSGNLSLEKSSIDSLLSEALSIVRHEIADARIKVVQEFATDLPEFQLDRKKFEKVLIGLFLNAIEAMEQSGTLTLRTGSRQLTTADVEHNPGGRGGRQFREGDRVVVIEIEDTGPGIPADALTKIFDPFFTTRETGKGMGLGLTLCRKIIELHHGTIEIVNLPGRGAKVMILLPFPGK